MRLYIPVDAYGTVRVTVSRNSSIIDQKKEVGASGIQGMNTVVNGKRGDLVSFRVIWGRVDMCQVQFYAL